MSPHWANTRQSTCERKCNEWIYKEPDPPNSKRDWCLRHICLAIKSGAICDIHVTLPTKSIPMDSPIGLVILYLEQDNKITELITI